MYARGDNAIGISTFVQQWVPAAPNPAGFDLIGLRLGYNKWDMLPARSVFGTALSGHRTNPQTNAPNCLLACIIIST